jgi:hypothetical protein
MNTALLFGLATIVVIAFVFAKIADPSSELKKLEENTPNSQDLKKEWDVGALLLRVGPVLTGFGLLGFLAQQWWGDLLYRLILIAIILVATNISAFVIYKFAQKSPNLKAIAEGLLLIGAFMFGGVLYTANEYAKQQTGAYILGTGELAGLWFLFLLPIAYLSRSVWVLGVNLIVSLVWFSTYLLTPTQKVAINVSALFNLKTSDIYVNPLLYLFLPVVGSIALILIYAWHQAKKHNLPESGYRAFYYITGLMAYLSVGALVYRGVVENFKFFQDSENGLIADLIVAILTLGVFLVDYLCKKTLKNYNINYLAPIIIFIASILGPLVFVGRYFIGFYFLEIIYIVWLLSDYLRQRSQLAQVLFYGFNGIQLFAMSTNNDNYNWFRLVIVLAIIMYASIVHYKNRSLVFYTVIAGVMALIFKVFATGVNGYLLIFALGLILMAFGIYYTQTRSKMLSDAENKVNN